MSVSQIDVVEFHCKTPQDGKQILDYLQALSELQKKHFTQKECKGFKDWDLIIGGFPVYMNPIHDKKGSTVIEVSLRPSRSWRYDEALHFFDIFLSMGLCEGILFKSAIEDGRIYAYSNTSQTNSYEGWSSAYINMEKWCEDNDIDCCCPEDEVEGDGWEDPKFDDGNIQAALDDANWHSGLDPLESDDEDDEDEA